MAKILTWAEMPTGITKGSPTNRCPTKSMIQSNVQSGYTAIFSSGVSANQLVTYVKANQTSWNFKVRLMGSVGNYSNFKVLVTIYHAGTNEQVFYDFVESNDSLTAHSFTTSANPTFRLNLGQLQGLSISTGNWMILRESTFSINYPGGTTTPGTLEGFTPTSAGTISIIVESTGTEGPGGGGIINPDLGDRVPIT